LKSSKSAVITGSISWELQQHEFNTKSDFLAGREQWYVLKHALLDVDREAHLDAPDLAA